MVRCFLALGSNLGDREDHLRSALPGLDGHGVRLIRSASLYSTEPKEITDQPWFLNTVIEVETDLEPEALMQACLDVELSGGRLRGEPNGPRTLDIDIILFGDRIVRSPDLTIPHPRYTSRRFVLEPLVEIAGDVVDPALGQPARQLLSEVSDPSAVSLYGPSPSTGADYNRRSEAG